MAKKTILLSIFTLMLACSPYGLTKIDVLIPGEVSIPSRIKKISIAMVDNEYTMPAGKLDSIDNLKLDPDYNYYKLAKDLLFGMRDELEQSPKFDTLILSGHQNFQSVGSDPDYDWNEITKICKQDSTDALLLVDRFYILDTLYILLSDEICYASYRLDNHIAYVILYPRLQLAIGRFTFNNKNESSDYGYNCDDALNNLPEGGDMLVQSCYETGQKAVIGIAPIWQDNFNRIYYTTGNKFLREGAFYARKNMWHEAAGYWRNGMESTKKNVNAKAAFNMALVCEIEDRIELAKKWVQISDSIKSTNLSKQYSKVLNNRLVQRKVLDKQMEIEK